MTRANDVAIYAPYAALLYGKRSQDSVAGGAELQTSLIARGLVERGLRVAHVVYPVEERLPRDPNTPSLVQRSEYRGDGRLGELVEAGAIWRSLARADARVYVVRGSGGHLVAAAAFCRARRRKLVFSASNDLDFDLERSDRSPRVLRAYRRSVLTSDRLVVQTSQQRELARKAFPQLDPLLIPSFCQLAEPTAGRGDHFLWSNRLVAYKRPELYLDLAEAVPEARFLMVAPTTSETDPALAEAVAQRAARLANVELLGGMPRERLLERMEGSTAIVTTSLVEGMPNTFLEAWARAIPVLSLSVDPDDRIAERGGGIVARDSPERFAEGARRLWSDPELRARLGASGREFVRSTHSPEAVADRWRQTIAPLLPVPDAG